MIYNINYCIVQREDTLRGLRSRGGWISGWVCHCGERVLDRTRKKSLTRTKAREAGGIFNHDPETQPSNYLRPQLIHRATDHKYRK